MKIVIHLLPRTTQIEPVMMIQKKTNNICDGLLHIYNTNNKVKVSEKMRGSGLLYGGHQRQLMSSDYTLRFSD